MSSGFDLPERWVRMRIVIIALFLLIPIFILLGARFQPWVPLSQTVRDPLAIAAQLAAEGSACCSRYLGAISTLGVMLWSAAASICILGAITSVMLRVEKAQIVKLILAGGLSIWLVVDDAFMLHEGYSIKLFGKIDLLHFVPIIAAALLFALIVKKRDFDNIKLLLLALCLLASSLIMDDFLTYGEHETFYEDALKFLGIACWAAYFLIDVVEILIRAAVRSTNPLSDAEFAPLSTEMQKRP